MASDPYPSQLRIVLLFLVGFWGTASAATETVAVTPQGFGDDGTINSIVETSESVVKKLDADFVDEPDFARDGGFAAMVGDRLVRVWPDFSDEPVRWDWIVRKDGALIFGSRDSLGSILWDTVLDLGDAGAHFFYLIAGADAQKRATLIMKRELIGGGGVTLRGDGRMDFTTANDKFTGRLIADGTELRLSAEGTLRKSLSVKAQLGGRFVIDNSELGHALDNRFGGDLILSGATFSYLTRFDASASESIGDLRINTGANRFDVSAASAGGSATSILTINKLLFGATGTVNFTTSGGADYGRNVTVRFKDAPDLWNGIIPHVTINGDNWATVDKDNRLREYDKYETGGETTWGPTVNAAPSTDQRLTADRQLNSLKLSGIGSGLSKDGRTNGRIIDLGGHMLGFTLGGILSTGDYRHQIRNGTLYTTSQLLEFHIYGKGGLEVAGVVANNIKGGWLNDTGLLKTGDGELILSGSQDNTFKGVVYINGGTLTLAKTSGAVGAAILGKSIYIGDGHRPAVLNIRGASNQINDSARVFMHGGLSGAAVLRLEKNAEGRAPLQNLRQLKVEGTGILEFSDMSGGAMAANTGSGHDSHAAVSPSVLILEDLDLNLGELVVRGWDGESSRILLDKVHPPDERLLSKIRFEGQGATHTEKVRFNNRDYWEIKAEFTTPPGSGTVPPTPEPATTGALIGTGVLALAAWRRLRRSRSK